MNEPLQFNWETPFLANSGSYPMRPTVAQSDWVAILNEIGFKHMVLYEFPVLTLPPGFSRSETHLREAWGHHKAGRFGESFLACHKAFECLGFNLYGGKVNRTELLEQLMNGQEESKRKCIEILWGSLQAFFHLGRHERETPVHLNEADSEMALLTATALLGYLAKLK